MRRLIPLIVVPGMLTLSSFAQKDQNTIIEKPNIPLATTMFVLKKSYEIKNSDRSFPCKLKLAPFVSQNLDRTNKKVGLTITVRYPSIEWRFTLASVVFVTDGKRSSQLRLLWSDWSEGSDGVSQTTIDDQPSFIRTLSSAKEAYLSLLLSGRPSPYDQISFKLSQGQLDDCRLMVNKYDESGR